MGGDMGQFVGRVAITSPQSILDRIFYNDTLRIESTNTLERRGSCCSSVLLLQVLMYSAIYHILLFPWIPDDGTL
ncbi:hypothetical protein M408DRAFT_328865 [Serendipita vermifera MAFF 305830]|uniref:Uncharacterized protein n=1 Tax=Serendipita vermifera MAFF 305830 TaxID=933852 RepID=A0A0C3BCM9_SERVB|nr:hypothetical protein M408DRAFT_328865 [Serendipita vermifera MAFF 305830]